MSSTHFKEKNSFWNCSLFPFKRSKTKTVVYFQGKIPFIAPTFSTFPLKWRIWNHWNATIATVCQLAFEQHSTFEAVVLTFAHPIFIWGIFQTPERRIESEIRTEEHATSCELLSLTCFGGDKQTKVCSEAFPGELFHQCPCHLAAFYAGLQLSYAGQFCGGHFTPPYFSYLD